MEIDLGINAFDIDFHPSSPLVAAGLISGRLQLYRYSDENNLERVFAGRAHKESCRAVRFVNAGSTILTASPDKSIMAFDVESNTVVARLKEAHGHAVNRLVNLSETTIASGDDMGFVKVWDTRQRVCCHTFHAHEEYVSDITYSPGSFQLIATSGDGTLSVCNLRKNNVQSRSEFSEDELLSVVIMKNGEKVICGTQNGAVLLYSWNHFNDCSDRFLGHPMSVTLLKFDEDTLISGSEDGVIRLVGILPNRIIQPIAEHSVFPIECLAFSSDRKYLGSISHDKMLKLWNLQDLIDGSGDAQQTQPPGEESDDDQMDVDGKPKTSSKGKKRKADGRGRHGPDTCALDFFADL